MEESGEMTYYPTEVKKAPSYAFLRENNFSLLKTSRSDGSHMRGPRRVLRLCMFSLLLPSVLITIPLYVRIVLYPPSQYPMMPTDQRLLSRHVSSVWCQGQLARMNGSFTAYLSPKTPHVQQDHRVHAMIHEISLGDDVKEYWGFHLLKGSKVTVSACSRYDGAQLLILRGVENLRRCAWIGEEDSEEEDDELEDAGLPIPKQKEEKMNIKDVKSVPNESEEEIKNEEETLEREEEKDVRKDVQSIETVKRGDGPKENPVPTIEKAAGEEKIEETQEMNGDSRQQKDELSEEIEMDASEERQQDLQQLLRKALHMSKGKKEILRILHSVGRNEQQRLPSRIKEILGVPTTSSPSRRVMAKGQVRQERSIATQDDNNGQEIFDEQATKVAVKRPAEDVEKIVGGQIFLPEGLKFERGKFNQTTANDGSNEENQSSYSSSEEALASCEGVIMTLPLVSYRSCSMRWTEINKFTYDIPVTGTYYFVFSSENEIDENRLFFNLTFERVVYDTTESDLVCANKTECLVPLHFWSNELAVVEVPEETTWEHSYVMDTTCEPRVAVYLTFMLLVPVLILFCAFH